MKTHNWNSLELPGQEKVIVMTTHNKCFCGESRKILIRINFYIPPHDSGGVLWFHVGWPCVCPSICQSYVCPSICVSFPDDKLSKHQWIFTKLGMCIDIVEIWFGIANGQIFKFSWSYLPETSP